MNKKKQYTIIKLGGSVITDKTQEKCVRNDIIMKLADEIIESQLPIILVHGGGSFGHPIAKKYAISGGVKCDIKDQIFGLTQTHYAMEQLNHLIIKEFSLKNHPIMPIQPSTVFKYTPKLQFIGDNILKSMLFHGITPIFYGDIIFSEPNTFSILSGDKIILKLCQIMAKDISKVIFTIDEDGLLQRSLENGILIEDIVSDIKIDEISKIDVHIRQDKIDVTGGLLGKLNEIKKIVQLGIPVQLLNGLKPLLLKKALMNQKIRSTFIHI